MFKKFSYFMLIGSFLFLLSGCASLNGDVPFRYQPSLLSAAKAIDKSVGVNLLSDTRPENDIAYTKSIKDISEKITSKLIEDFEKSKLFKNIHFAAQTDDNLIIDGTVNRFTWKMYATTISYIPGIHLAIYFGAPAYQTYGIADITLVIKDKNSGLTLGTFQAESKVVEQYSLYNMKTGDAGAELAEAFRNVAKKLKEDIQRKIK